MDVDYAESGGPRPMREVLRARAAYARRYTHAQLLKAYQARARDIGLLAACLCCYPIVQVETPSGHESWCPSEALRKSFEAAQRG